MQIFEIYFLNPIFFFLFFFLFIFLFLFKKFRERLPIYSSFSDLNKVFKINSFIFYYRFLLIILIFSLFVLIFSNPNLKNISQKSKKNGIDIILALDISTSMKVNDLLPNRLESAKKVLVKFLEKQKTNRVGLSVFSGKAFSVVPLTFDYDVLKQYILDLDSYFINQDYFSGTAIGDAILVSKNMFDKEQKRKKVIVLISDGESNIGINSDIASLTAKEENIKIFTIGIGGDKETFSEIKIGDFSQKVLISPLNSEELKKISENTYASFFRATDNKSLEGIFSDLEKLEKNEIENNISFIYKEIYDYFAYFISFFMFLLLISFFDFRQKFYLK